MTPLPDDPFRRAALQRLFDHGGDVRSAMQAFPDAPKPWIDLSTGVNPIAYPVPELAPDAWARLPEPLDLQGLLAAAARAYGATPDSMAAAAGTQAILQTLPSLLPARQVSILGPTYGEHERVWRASGAEVAVVGSLEAAKLELVVVVNPNNPDGRLYPRADILDFARRLNSENRRLIVDEAFMDFEEQSIAGLAPPSVVVLRSFGKTYGLAGLRLGFAIAKPTLAARLRAALGPWPVSGPAIAVGMRALSDPDWFSSARVRLDEDGGWLEQNLVRAGFEIVGGTRLFRLARRVEAAVAFRALCEQGILTRPFSWSADLLRIGLPTREQRPRIAEALRALPSQASPFTKA